MTEPVLPPVETIYIIATSKWSIKNNAKQEELREEAFVYMYRFWLRALLGDYKTAKRIENEIFGSTDSGPKIKLQVVNNSPQDKAGVIEINDKIKIRCVYATEADKNLVHPLLHGITKVVAYLGGVGGKTARGYGCFKIDTQNTTETQPIEEIEINLKEIYRILKDSFKVSENLSVEITDNSLVISNQVDKDVKYPFLRKVKGIPLKGKKITYGFTELKERHDIMVNNQIKYNRDGTPRTKLFIIGGQKVTVIEKVLSIKFDFRNEEHQKWLQFFGSLNPRYASPITVSVHPTLDDYAVFCLFQPSHPDFSFINTEKVFDQTCKSYE